VAGIHDELQAILDATMDVVAVFDSERRFQFVNDAACRFYGRTREQLLCALACLPQSRHTLYGCGSVPIERPAQTA